MKTYYLLFILFMSSALTFSIPPSTGFILTYQDLFDSTYLNTTDWYYRVGARFDGFNQQQNVRIDSGRLKVDFKRELIKRTPVKADTIAYSGGGIISNKCFGYGYYEVKSKTFSATAGLHTSFWSIGNLGNGTTTPRVNQVLEIDGYEIDSHNPYGIYSNFHNYIGSHTDIGGVSNTSINSSTKYIINGYEWAPTYIKWYTNGVLTRTYNNPPVYAAQNVYLTALGSTYFIGKNPIDTTKLPGHSSWEYFKYYVKDMSGYNWVGANSFEYNNGTGFVAPYIWNLQFPVGWCENGSTANSYVVKDSVTAQFGKYYLKHAGSIAYSVETSQHCEFIPNGTYTFKAWIRSSGGQSTAQMIATGMGSADCQVNIPGLSAWTQITLDNIVVKNNSCEFGFRSVASANQWLDIDYVEFVQKSSAAESILIKDPSFDLAVNKSSSPVTNNWSSGIGTSTNSYQPGSTSSVLTDINENKYFSCNMTANNSDIAKWYLANLSQLTSDTVKASNYTLRLKARTKNPTDSTYFVLKLSSVSNLGAAIVTSIQNNSTEISWVNESASITALTSKQLRIKPTNTWKEYTANLTLVPTIAAPARIYFMFPRLGTFDIDDVSLELTPQTAQTNLVNVIPVDHDFATFISRNRVVKLQIDNNSRTTVEIYNLMGELFTKNTFYGQYQSPILKSGVYVVRIMNENRLMIKKIVIED
jgi:hypothetical protein